MITFITTFTHCHSHDAIPPPCWDITKHHLLLEAFPPRNKSGLLPSDSLAWPERGDLYQTMHFAPYNIHVCISKGNVVYEVHVILLQLNCKDRCGKKKNLLPHFMLHCRSYKRNLLSFLHFFQTLFLHRQYYDSNTLNLDVINHLTNIGSYNTRLIFIVEAAVG